MEVELKAWSGKDFLCKLWQTVARIEPKDKEILSKVSESGHKSGSSNAQRNIKPGSKVPPVDTCDRCFDRLKNRNRPWSGHAESCL